MPVIGYPVCLADVSRTLIEIGSSRLKIGVPRIGVSLSLHLIRFDQTVMTYKFCDHELVLVPKNFDAALLLRQQ